jgi:hypothetical protein
MVFFLRKNQARNLVYRRGFGQQNNQVLSLARQYDGGGESTGKAPDKMLDA